MNYWDVNKISDMLWQKVKGCSGSESAIVITRGEDIVAACGTKIVPQAILSLAAGCRYHTRFYAITVDYKPTELNCYTYAFNANGQDYTIVHCGNADATDACCEMLKLTAELLTCIYN